ncbi:MAG: hypothetical protein HOW73_29460 [Polyangiaceae bacterium]|nr:hypothetical protein [Polyangiaceae bacterium]
MLRMNHWMTIVIAAALSGCWDYEQCPTPADLGTERLPGHLSETGLYADITAGTLAADVLPYKPQFELWSDGAEKQRWILLPKDKRIDTKDMDAWVFPEGTKLWKEFRRDGVRVETRLFQKVGPSDDDWVGIAYVWAADQSDATATPSGAANALGTNHDVPNAGQCVGCHAGRKSRILGFSAIQLSASATDGAIDLEGLIANDRLSNPPERNFSVPGNETERAALGYLHANCSHCHNQNRPETDGPRCFDPRKDVDFGLYVSDLRSTADTAAYRTGADYFEPGDSEGSRLVELVARRGDDKHMPPLATEKVDEDGVELLRMWIDGM